MDSVLMQRIRQQGLTRLAVLGLAKNTGKTVALNHLLASAQQARMAVGLTSIGRDGEERDQVFSFPKPPVQVWPGMLVATARDTLARAKVRTKTLAATGLDSPMGEILLVRVQEAGAMEVAGASRGNALQQLVAQLKTCGADLVFLDGALGRSHHASPALADGVVLSTGMALGGSIDDVLRKTRERLAVLGLAGADAALARRCEAVFVQGGVGVWDAQGAPLWHVAQATLTAGAQLRALGAQRVGCVAFGGAVGRLLWPAVLELAQRNPGLQVLVADGTRLFRDASEIAQLAHCGGALRAWRALRIVGITVNPFSPLGGDTDARTLLAAARDSLPEYAVSDVQLEYPSPGAPS